MTDSSWNYIFWLMGFIWAPAAFCWLVNLGQVRKHARALVTCSFLLAALCIPVEYWIVKEALIMRHGHFLGVFFLGMPLEDYLFFISFPFLLAPLALKLNEQLTREDAC